MPAPPVEKSMEPEMSVLLDSHDIVLLESAIRAYPST